MQKQWTVLGLSSPACVHLRWFHDSRLVTSGCNSNLHLIFTVSTLCPRSVQINVTAFCDQNNVSRQRARAKPQTLSENTPLPGTNSLAHQSANRLSLTLSHHRAQPGNIPARLLHRCRTQFLRYNQLPHLLPCRSSAAPHFIVIFALEIVATS